MRIFLAMLLFFWLSVNAWGATFKGKVIDAETKQPIEGAVVVASWIEERATPAGSTSRLKDVKETLTDMNGEWVIEGPRGRDMGNITAYFTLLTGTYIVNPPEFLVFKPGYCSWPKGFTIGACRGKIKPEGNDKVAEGETVELPKLTKKEDRSKSSAIWPSLIESDKESLKKIKTFLKLLDEENRSLGFSEDPRIKELKNEK